MLRQPRIVARLFSLAILVMSTLAFGGCSPVSTPTPEITVIAAIPVVTIVAHPNIAEVPAGEQIAVSAETTGVNLQIRWSAKRGKLSNIEGPSTIYTAPQEPGLDVVDVVVTGDGGGTTTRTVAFTVVSATPVPSDRVITTSTSTPPFLFTEAPTAVRTSTPRVLPTIAPTATPAPPSPLPKPGPGIIELDPADFIAQDGDRDGIAEEFFLDTRYGAVPGLHIQEGVDLSGYDLEFTLQGGDGRQVQIWLKDQTWSSVYSFPFSISSHRPIRYDPVADGRNVNEFDDLGNIYAIGAKVFGGVEGIQILSARLISKLTPSPDVETDTSGRLVTPAPEPHADVEAVNGFPPIVDGKFVTRHASQLFLGDSEFDFGIGANVYYMQAEMAYRNRDSVVQTLETMVKLGMPVARIWAFNDHDPKVDPAAIQIAPGEYREQSLVALDQVLAEAKQRNIRLILTLVNNWPDYGGVNRYLEWYQGQCNCEVDRNEFYSNETIKNWYRDYVAMLVNRTNTVTGIPYKDESAVLAWELGNELRNPGGEADDLLAWQEEMGLFIKSLGVRQLVADGGEGFDDAYEMYRGLSNSYAVHGDEGASYHRLLEQPSIDMVSYHLYPSKWGLNSTTDVETWIRVHEELAREAGKVAYVGEFGAEGPDAQRAETYDRWLTIALDDNQSAGALVWGLNYEGRPDYDGFSIYCPAQTETCTALRTYAASLASGSAR